MGLKVLIEFALIVTAFGLLHVIVQVALAQNPSPLNVRSYSKKAHKLEKAYVLFALIILLVAFMFWIVASFQNLKF